MGNGIIRGVQSRRNSRGCPGAGGAEQRREGVQRGVRRETRSKWQTDEEWKSEREKGRDHERPREGKLRGKTSYKNLLCQMENFTITRFFGNFQCARLHKVWREGNK